MEFSTKREKKVLLTNYKGKVEEIRVMIYDTIKTAAELQRPHSEMEALIKVSKEFGGGWWTLERELEELAKEK